MIAESFRVTAKAVAFFLIHLFPLLRPILSGLILALFRFIKHSQGLILIAGIDNHRIKYSL